MATKLSNRAALRPAVIAAVNGLFGDELAERDRPLAGTMAIRRRGNVVAPTADCLAAAFPSASSRVVVSMHGWCLTEGSWSRHPRTRRETTAAAMANGCATTLDSARFSCATTPACTCRSTAGRSRNYCSDCTLTGRFLFELVLVGHSMGGLVARSACHYGAEQQHRWAEAVSHVVCLGSPHLGADLEKGVSVASWALARFPETRAIATFLNARSDGVKD